MSIEKPVYMTVMDVDNTLCGWDCPFRMGAREYDCNLFSVKLEDNKQYVDQNEIPLKERCSQCLACF